MNKRKIIILFILILLLLPEIGDYSRYFDDNPYAQRFWNLWYQEGRYEGEWRTGEWICFDVIPIAHYTYAYRSLFMDVRYRREYCEDFEFMIDDSISLFIGIEHWAGDDSIYLPLLWISISTKDVNFTLLGELIT